MVDELCDNIIDYLKKKKALESGNQYTYDRHFLQIKVLCYGNYISRIILEFKGPR